MAEQGSLVLEEVSKPDIKISDLKKEGKLEIITKIPSIRKGVISHIGIAQQTNMPFIWFLTRHNSEGKIDTDKSTKRIYEVCYTVQVNTNELVVGLTETDKKWVDYSDNKKSCWYSKNEMLDQAGLPYEGS